MNRNEGSSLPGTAPVPSISRHVIEDLVTNENAPQMIDTPTPIRSGLRSRSGLGSGQQQHVTERRRVTQTDTTDAAQRLIRFQIETTSAEHELWTERVQIEAAETALRSERMAIARLQLDTERAELEARKAVAEATVANIRPRRLAAIMFLPKPRYRSLKNYVSSHGHSTSSCYSSSSPYI
jgi:hypothetical protein